MNELINERLIALDVNLLDKTSVINEIAEMLHRDDRLNEKAIYIQDVFDREAMVPTGIGDLIAIPHARSVSIKCASLVYIRLASPIQWSEEENAQFIFGIAVPADNVDNQHLKILASVAKKLIDDKIKKIIIESPSKQQILEALIP